MLAQQLVVVGPNRNELAANETLAAACASIVRAGAPSAAQADLLRICAALDALEGDLSALGAALERLVPEEAFAVGDSLTDASDRQVANVLTRLRGLRGARSGTGATRFADDGGARRGHSTGAGATADTLLDDRLQFFVNAYVSDGEYDGEVLQQDAELGASSVSLGLDYRLGERFTVGTALGLSRNESRFRGGAGEMSADGIDLTLFGTYGGRGTGYADLVLDIGGVSYALERRINLVGTDLVVASAETSANTAALSAGLGRSFAAGRWTVEPYARGSVTIASVDGYSETVDTILPGFGLALRIDAQSVRSTTLSIGGQVSTTIGTRRAVLVPRLGVELQLETEAEKNDIGASFLADPDRNLLAVEGEERDTAYANAGAGLHAVFANNRSAYVQLDTRLAHDNLSQRWFRAGLRWEF